MTTKINISALKASTVMASTFSQAAYLPATNTSFVPPSGFVKVDPAKVAFTATTPNDQFSATTYVNVTTGQVVIAYRGSTTRGVALQSLNTAESGTWSPQLTDATNYAAKAKVAALELINIEKDRVGQARVTETPILVTGHSLGGMLAQVVSKMFGYPAETFARRWLLYSRHRSDLQRCPMHFDHRAQRCGQVAGERYIHAPRQITAFKISAQFGQGQVKLRVGRPYRQVQV